MFSYPFALHFIVVAQRGFPADSHAAPLTCSTTAASSSSDTMAHHTMSLSDFSNSVPHMYYFTPEALTQRLLGSFVYPQELTEIVNSYALQPSCSLSTNITVGEVYSNPPFGTVSDFEVHYYSIFRYPPDVLRQRLLSSSMTGFEVFATTAHTQLMPPRRPLNTSTPDALFLAPRAIPIIGCLCSFACSCQTRPPL